MGSYNPHAPHIIGQEWVPIRDAAYTPDDIVERGYVWTNNNTVVPVSGAFYVAQTPESHVFDSIDLISVYPTGAEDQTGPIKVLHIPVSSVTATGNTPANIDVSAGFTALNNSSDDLWIHFLTGGNSTLLINFDVTSYSQQLFGKRILDVSMRYSIAATPEDLQNLSLFEGFTRALAATDKLWLSFGLDGVPSVGQPNTINKISLTDVNPMWDTTVVPTAQRDVRPWRYQELARFSPNEGLATRTSLIITNNITDVNSSGAYLLFVDLEVTYCEEQRVKYGGLMTHDALAAAATNPLYYNLGPMYTRLVGTDFTNTGSLTPGQYTTTLVHRDLGGAVGLTGAPQVNALRELYALSPQYGRNVQQTLVTDQTFVVEDSDVLTHLTLHTASGVVTGSHVYGVQGDAPVYGSITAIQEIEDDPAVPAALYPQVRFYARRFGDTTTALRLIDVATGLSTASISVADFDALPEIVDGWKEVNLRFATAPTFSAAAGDIDWRWDAVGETAGNQWQILAATAQSPSGTQSIAKASYYAPQGDTVTLTWGSPAISGTAEDTLGDAVLIFSRDPNPVSGFAIAVATQAVTGIALDCGTPPGCIPTGIGYVSLTWSAQTVLPVTGFGAYELERYDAIDDRWTQIMNATSPTVTGFGDYEARVGVQSLYRIRTCNALDFCGPWVTGSATVSSPGVGINGDGSSVLIFTTNEAPLSNLAYVMNWEGTPVETFVFPEADTQQLQRMYGKNFFTVFRPLERGGEQFTRTIIVNAAAIPLPSLADFKNLRNLAWQDVPYVCVRDELGNRWYANVRVPDATVRQDRTVYLAQVEVTETTDTPSPVDPAM